MVLGGEKKLISILGHCKPLQRINLCLLVVIVLKWIFEIACTGETLALVDTGVLQA